MTDKAKEQERFYEGGCAHALKFGELCNKCTTELRAALASRPAETPREMCPYCPHTLQHHRRDDLSLNGVNYPRLLCNMCHCSLKAADHPAVTPQPKTEPCTCNAQRDGDMQWTHAPNCPRSESWQRRVAKDASAAEPERCAYIDCTYQRVCGMTREEHADLKARGLIPNPDHEFVAPTVTHTTTPTEPEGGSDFAWLIERTDGPIPTYWDGRATRNNHGPRVTYHHDANSAVRFARQEDAERIIAWLLEGEPVVAREHGWFRATAAPSDPPPEKCTGRNPCTDRCDGETCYGSDAPHAAGANGRNADSPLVKDPTAGQSGSDPQPSEQEEDWFMGYLRSTPINERTVHGVWEAAWHARAEYERNHRPAVDIEDIIKHCRLSLDGKSVSLTELRKALQKATAR